MMPSRFDPTIIQVVLESTCTFSVIPDGGATAQVSFPDKLFTPFIPGAGFQVWRLGRGVYVVHASWSMEDHGSVRRVSLGGR
jgi:hypothetical protein